MNTSFTTVIVGLNIKQRGTQVLIGERYKKTPGKLVVNQHVLLM